MAQLKETVIHGNLIIDENIIWGGRELIPNSYIHNGIYRGKDLTNIYSIEEICNQIVDGSFTDLFIGDYFDINISSSYTSNETVRCVIAGFDMYYRKGDTELTKHHAVIVPKNCFSKTIGMNINNVTTNGYTNTEMFKSYLPKYSTAVKAVFGSHLLTYRDLLTNSTSTTDLSSAGAGWKGCSNGWGWYDVTLRLMNEVQVYGATVFSSSGYDVGCANNQLPLFRLNPSSIVAGLGGVENGRQWYWLSSVASSASFVYVTGSGSSSAHGASDTHGVRPLWLIG